jgi:hypothetical protein
MLSDVREDVNPLDFEKLPHCLCIRVQLGRFGRDKDVFQSKSQISTPMYNAIHART